MLTRYVINDGINNPWNAGPEYVQNPNRAIDMLSGAPFNNRD